MPRAVPAVSILMPVYNAERYLGEALEDLLRQTFADFELVAVEDGSTDRTAQVLQHYAERDPRIVVVKNEDNLGLPRSLNRGLQHCAAPLVARADADDRYHAERLARQTTYMASHPDVGLLSCASQRTDADGNWSSIARFPTKDGHIRMRELFVNSFSHPGVMFRTDLVRSLGGYNPAFTVGEDADLWARLRERTKAANLPEALVYYRVLPTSLMRTTTSERQKMGPVVRQRLLSQYLQRPVDMDDVRAAVATFHPRRSAPGTLEELHVGQSLLSEVLRAARGREDDDTLRYFRDQVATALLQHADFQRDIRPLASWRLLGAAIRWSPWLAVRRRGSGQLRRCSVSAAKVLRNTQRRRSPREAGGRNG